MNPLIPWFILQHDNGKTVQGSLEAASLFVDISGFTSLTGQLVRHGRPGAEALANSLRFFFDPLVEAVHSAGGFITGFAGDAFTAIFPDNPDHDVADYALHSANRMQDFFRSHATYSTAYGAFPFSIKIGLSWGRLDWGIVYVTPERAVCYFSGPAIDGCARVEHGAGKGQILLDRGFYQQALDHEAEQVGPDAFRLISLGEMEGEREPVASPEVGGDGLHFLAPGITDILPQGEFRDVTSVFMSIENVVDLPDFILLLHELGTQYGGAFTGVDFGDKGANSLVHFGAPVAHENNTQRALDFALSLRERRSPSIRLRFGVTRDIRYVGFNGGAERHEFACLGRGTNLAARLMMKAPWNGIWCDQKVHLQVESGYECEAVGDILCKGFRHPVKVYTVNGKKRSGSPKAFQAKGLVGRDRALAALDRLVRPIHQGEFAGIIYITGEPGIGKSFMVDCYRRHLESRWKSAPVKWIYAPADQTLREALNPMESALREAFVKNPDAGEEESKAAFEKTFQELSKGLGNDHPLARDLAGGKALLAELAGLGTGDSPMLRLARSQRFEVVVEALRAWILAESSVQPVIFQLEDAQWSDEETLRTVTSIARSAAGYPLAILCTCRPKDDRRPFRIPLPAGSSVPEQTIELKRLQPEEMRKLAELHLGMPVDAMLGRLLTDKAEGNPFFAEQLLSYWRDSAQVERNKEDSMTTASIMLLPGNVNTLLMARLDRMHPDFKRTVQAASVLGRTFSLPVLEAMFKSNPHIGEAVEKGVDQGIWRRLGGDSFGFRHALFRDAAYEMQARAHLQKLHFAAARAIESVYGEELEKHLRGLGHHWKRAGVGDRARRYYLGGARRSSRRYAHDEARGLYRAYFRLCEEQTPEMVRVRNEFARDVLAVQGRYEEALTEHRRALEEARAVGDPGAQAMSLQGLATVSRIEGKLEDARKFAQQAMELYSKVGERRSEATCMTLLAACLYDLGQLGAAQGMFREALGVHRDMGNVQGEAVTLSNLGAVCRELGEPEASRQLQETALRLHQEVGNRRSEGITLENLGSLAQDALRFDEANAYYEYALTVHREVADRRYEAVTLCSQARLRHVLGQQEEARSMLEQACKILDRLENRFFKAEILCVLAQFERRVENRLSDAELHLREAEALVHRYHDRLGRLRCLCERGHWKMAEGKVARDLLEEAGAIFRETGISTDGPSGRLFVALRTAVESFENGLPVFRGEAFSELPEGFLSWLDQQ